MARYRSECSDPITRSTWHIHEIISASLTGILLAGYSMVYAHNSI